jgi:hypothetical protein
MKRMMLAAVLILAFSTASFARKLVAEGKTFTELGNYKIELADNPLTVNGENCKTYIISYANTPLEVTVVICKDRKCKKYIVLSDELSVQYVCNANYFGVELLEKSFEKTGFRTSASALNRSEYFKQKKISHGRGDELENTQLIAAFYPMLLNDRSEIVATR